MTIEQHALEVSQAPQREKKPSTITDMVLLYAKEFSQALPAHIDGDQWVRQGIAALRKDDNLLHAANNNPKACLQVFAEAARLGHVPGTKEYYLIPRGNKDLGTEINPRTGKSRKRQEITGLEGYMGVIERIYRAGAVTSVIVEIVHENDTFRFSPGIDERPIHEVDWFGGQRGKPIGGYTYAVMDGGGTSRVVVMSAAEILEHRARSDSWKNDWSRSSSPWTTDPKAMWLKGLALDTPILTPFGWSTMADLEVGNLVFDMNGEPCRVAAKSEVKNLPCYRVTFANGEQIVCDDEHFWFARIGQQGKHCHDWRVHPISAIAEAKESGMAVTMPIAGVVDLPRRELPIDPWVLGFWLGDGNKNSGLVTVGERDLDEVLSSIRSAGYEVGAVSKDSRSSAYGVRVKGLTKELANAGLLGHKHIPSEYLFASVDQRVALLRGLMDSDGTIDKARGRAVFSNTNTDLAEGVAHLARSLGEVINTRDQATTGFGKSVTSAIVSWRPTTYAPVTLSRKVGAMRDRKVAPYRSVRSVELIESVPTQCISVDSGTRSYLAGADMVPTHNTIVRQLEKWVPTNSEYLKEKIRIMAEAKIEADRAAAAQEVKDGDPIATAPEPEVVEGEVEDERDE